MIPIPGHAIRSPLAAGPAPRRRLLGVLRQGVAECVECRACPLLPLCPPGGRGLVACEGDALVLAGGRVERI